MVALLCPAMPRRRGLATRRRPETDCYRRAPLNICPTAQHAQIQGPRRSAMLSGRVKPRRRNRPTVGLVTVGNVAGEVDPRRLEHGARPRWPPRRVLRQRLHARLEEQTDDDLASLHPVTGKRPVRWALHVAKGARCEPCRGSARDALLKLEAAVGRSVETYRIEL